MSSKLILHREKSTFGFLRNIAIKLDGQEFGRIKNGETKTYDKSPGKCEIVVQVDFLKDAVYTFELKENETRTITISYPKASDWILFFFLISMIVFLIINLLTEIKLPYLGLIEFLVFSAPLFQLLYFLLIKKSKFISFKAN